MTTISSPDGITAVGATVLGSETLTGRVRVGNVFVWLSIAWLVLLSGAALLAPQLGFLDDPNELGTEFLACPPINLPVVDILECEQSAGWDHPFGTNALGQDILAQVVWGGRVSLLVGLVGTAVGITLGGLLGLLAGYYRGWVDTIVSGVISAMLSIPALVLVSFIIAMRDARTVGNVMLAVCILAVPSLARIVRAKTLEFADREFVQAAKVLGAKDRRIVFREILPNVMPAMVSFAFLAVGIIIVAESSLSFLGQSVERPTATWGKIVADGVGKMDEGGAHMVLMPSLVLFFTVLALNYIGDRFLKRFDIREGNL